MRQLDCSSNSTHVHLHPHIFDVLFKHKKDISEKLSNLKGLHSIDHLALTLIDPQKEMLVFSLTPSVEFNILAQGLWKHDPSFNPQSYASREILFWDKINTSEHAKNIKQVKETNHRFSLSFSVLKTVQQFNFIYSFATRQANPNRSYYQSIIHELFAFGDYGYKQLFPIYQKYCKNPPFIEAAQMKKHLRLIVNNGSPCLTK